ncbi:type II toxin-antitoxin system PemK/MazF family toxin [Streptomyces microflavus]|uniref:Type II toxin-antitoxin system PemK/MazF family toxin n=2 Tax=Streptomyces TaxID=1883 RepID=A0A7H8MM95_STRMI|nr:MULTISPECIES: type II toxin-antitoxin system PemK/MazF family toxin [Streptomyces]MBW3358698.1 type II toxin-antitoxin system PemK/MazF family toxin [Streptomyces sp. 09ZI22]MEE1731855.1 type II toxin-antitoxin system PemK/MazF family toxin [Streptomyces sp. BE282]OXY88045.1 transcriptional modulator of MazE/toxin, MazF [Streptomyces sp. 2R]QKW43253.1 type II toxin-antitoxin system PemK/MazF family toxin [Streptomyces microflavus]QQZ54368.1 type II toxin-antitoxin system PemK/MazF family to
MDMFWWVALVAVVLLALVAAVVDGRGRSDRGPRSRRPRQPEGSTRPPSRPSRPAGKPSGPAGRGDGRTPRAGEVWWADVPYEDGPGSKDRPCLVLSVRGRGRGRTAVVAKITSKHHEERPGVIALPAGTVGDQRGRQSFLETDELREVRIGGFRRRVGAVDAELWERVRGLGAG